MRLVAGGGGEEDGGGGVGCWWGEAGIWKGHGCGGWCGCEGVEIRPGGFDRLVVLRRLVEVGDRLIREWSGGG